MIKKAEYISSYIKEKDCPQSKIPEYAFIGRSNVGKSSLINMLAQNKSLAKISGRPGKTQTINFFLINDTWHLVDLPGYGYAKVSKTQRAAFKKQITDYIGKRKQLVNLFVLIDSRLEPQKLDLEFMGWLGEAHIPFSMVFTKSDKLGGPAVDKNIAKYKRTMLKQWEEMPPYFITSATTARGREELLAYIENLNELPPESEEE